MKKLLLITNFVILSVFSYAQVGVNNSTPKALLDIKVSDAASPDVKDGILIPRVSTLAYTPGADQHSMLVFLDTAETYTEGTLTCNRTPGFYSWDNSGSNWSPVSTKNTAQGSGLVLYQNDCRYYQIADAFSGVFNEGSTEVAYSWVTNVWRKFIIDNEIIDNYGSYDNTTGIFTCRETGTYRVSMTLDLNATVINNKLNLIFGLVKVAAGNDGSEKPNSAGNVYVTRNTAVFTRSTPAYAEATTVVTFANLEAGERYVFGGLTTAIGDGESLNLNSVNSGATGGGYSTSFAIDRVR